MGEDDRPPLSRRVPNENRGHKPAARVGMRQLPDEVVARMRAAVEAGAAAAEAADPVALPDNAAALELMTPPSGVPAAEPDPAAPETAPRGSHKGSPSRGSRKRAGHAARQAAAKWGSGADPAAAGSGPAADIGGVAPAAGPSRGGASDADTEQFAAIPPATAGRDEPAPAPADAPPLPPARQSGAGAPAGPVTPAPAPAPQAPVRPPLPASTIRPVPVGRARAASGAGGSAARRRYRVTGAVAAGVAVILAVTLTLVFRQAPPSTTPKHVPTAAQTRGLAAAWIAGQVSPTALISCDIAMCQALAADGFPPYDTRPLSPGGSLLASTLVIATAAVRHQLGAQLAADAPGVIASFGAGASRVDVRVIAPHGAAAYEAALSADLALRKQSGTEFLSSSRVGVSAQAGARISAGQVDSRLLIMLATVASYRPIMVVSFGDAAPGASLDVSPLRSAVFEQVPGGPQLANASFVAMMLGAIRQPVPQFKVASARQVQLPGGVTGVRMEFFAPEPLGLLNGGN